MTEFRAREEAVAEAGAVRRFAATLLRVERLADNVAGLVMAANTSFRYRPGQYLSVILADGWRRCFSMASPYKVGCPIELHIRRRPGGRFSDTALAALKVGDNLTFEGPFGQVDWREGTGPAILMGTGTGLAPLKALLEHGLAAGGERQIHLYWGGRTPSDLYLHAHFHHLARAQARFTFTPLLSRPHANWLGRRGYVQHAVAEDFPDLHEADIYACGSGAMISAARARLSDLPGFDEDRFLADAFEPAVPVAATRGVPSIRLSVDVQGAVRSVPGCVGDTLLCALQVAGTPILSVCGGKASCGTCKVTVAEAWRVRVPNPERTEQRLLANLEYIGPGDRLACQIRLTPETDGLAIRLVSETMALRPA